MFANDAGARMPLDGGWLCVEEVAGGDLSVIHEVEGRAVRRRSLREHTGLDGRWAWPRLLHGPDGVPWLLAVNLDRRMAFAFRFVGEELQQGHEARSVFHVEPAEDGTFEENLAALADMAASRDGDGVELALTADLAGHATRRWRLGAPAPEQLPGGLMMIDGSRLADRRNARLVLNRPRKHPDNPLFTPGPPGAPDEVRVFNRGTVMIEGGTFRMWYAASQHPGPLDTLWQRIPNWQQLMHVCYAESDDGIEWRRPGLGLVEWDGGTDNNLLPNLWRMPIIVKTDRSPVAGEPYVCTEQLFPATPEEAVLHTSADGIDWHRRPAYRSYPRSRPLYFEFDCLFFDENAALWRSYGSYGPAPMYRTAGLATSPDLIHWEGYPENPVVDPLQVREDRVHDLIVWQEGGLYVGLLQAGGGHDDYQFALVISRDGVHFSRPEPHAMFLSGGDGWEQGMMLAATPVAVGDDWWLYYSCLREETPGELDDEVFLRRASMGLATIRRGGYAYAEPADASVPALIETTALHWAEPATLALSANAAVAGSLRVEVLDARTGRPLPGRSLAEGAPCEGDGLELPVRWRGGDAIEARPDLPIRLRAELRGAGTRLYGLSWDVARR